MRDENEASFDDNPRCPSCGNNVTPANPQESYFYCDECRMNICADNCYEMDKPEVSQ